LETTEEAYDYVIVGAGSAGCVLAGRLSADGHRVLVLEAGPADRHPMLHVPAGFSWPLTNERYNWAYHSEPEPGLDGRRMYQPRGRVLGGSSSINGMVYVRGNPGDYAGWAAQPGLADWSWAHVLPYFIHAETWHGGRSPWRGTAGPLHTSRRNDPHLLDAVFLEAAAEAGLPRTEDMNGRQQEGIGAMDMTVHHGRRWSAAMAYLHPARARANLSIHTRARVTGLEFDGRRASGVRYLRGGRMRQVRAAREVLLCAGAIDSPKLLMLAGLGPADALRAHGIEVRADLPGVGANLQDHLEVYVQYACREPITLHDVLEPLGKARAGLRWLATRQGPAASNHFEAGGFLRSTEVDDYPDLQYHFLPLAIAYDGSRPSAGHGFQAHVGPMRPSSRGRVWLDSRDPLAPPRLRFDYLTTEADRRTMRAAIRLTREIFAQPAFARYRGRELAPGDEARSDAELDAFARRLGESAYHPAGTCAMGAGPGAVVDGAGRVHGVEGLRVVDASIMPRVINANLNGAVIMMAEKIADAIRGRPPLTPYDPARAS